MKPINISLLGVALLLSMFFSLCEDYYETGESNRFNEFRPRKAVARITVDTALNSFSLPKKTFRVVIDTMGYYCTNVPDDDSALVKTVPQDAELYPSLVGNQYLKQAELPFCRVNLKDSSLKLTFHGTSIAALTTLLIMDCQNDTVRGDYQLYYHDGSKVCTCRGDSVKLRLNKYPVKKGDTLKGHLEYHGEMLFVETKVSLRNEGYKLQSSKDTFHVKILRPTIYRGYFECKVE